MKRLQTPAAWLGSHINWVGFTVLAVLAAFFRLWQLPTLPPGLSGAEARVGLEAWNLAHHGWLPGLTAANDYAPLWTWLEALGVMLLGPTTQALRLWPALLGIAAVLMTWRWAHDWFGRRVAWVAALVMAVTPWSVILSRSALPTMLMLVLVPLTLWAATWAYHRRSMKRAALLGAVLVLDLLAGPLGWLLAAAVLGAGIIALVRRQELMSFDRARLLGLGVLGAGLAGLGYLVGVSWPQLSAANVLPSSFSAAIENLGRTLLMFNLRGDVDPTRNFAGEPLLNAFIGLMFVAGILASCTRIKQRCYWHLLALFAILLVPAWLTTGLVPNAAKAAAVLPLVAVLAGIGVSYMLELWYATFPVNSAARSVGQAVIIVLLGLSVFQGYTQHFRAWASAGDTATAYHESIVALSAQLNAKPPVAPPYVITTAEEAIVLSYLSAKSPYTHVLPKAVAALPNVAGPKSFLVSAAARPEAARQLALKYPGGTLKPYMSAYTNNEIYYTYEVAK